MMVMGSNFGLLRFLCGTLFFLLLCAALVALVIWALRAWSRSSSGRTGGSWVSGSSAGTVEPGAPAGGTNRALDILKERYARGEITKEQYDQMRRDLAD